MDGTRRPTTRTHTIITRAVIVFFPGFFYEAIVQHVIYATDSCRVDRVVYPSWGTTTRNFQFSGTGVVAQSCAATCQMTRKDGAIMEILNGGFWFDCPFFQCMPTGRHSGSTPDIGRVRLCSRLPCGLHGAGSPTSVVCSRELVSCGNGGTLCRS